MPILTLRLPEGGGNAERTAVEATVREAGGTITWHDDNELELTYGSCVLPDQRLTFAPNITVHNGDIIAVAVTPSRVEAIPRLLDALGGVGRPVGVVAAFGRRDSVVLDIAWERTLPSFVLRVADIELHGIGATRSTRLLTPLSAAAAAAIAADGLRTPDITTDRILDVLLERNHVAS